MGENGIKKEVMRRVHRIADEVDWLHLSIDERKQYYEAWTTDPAIGGLLAQVIEENRIRVYLKDTVIRAYNRKKRPNISDFLGAISVNCYNVTETYSKPQAVVCDDIALYTLTVAKEWKTAIVSAFERAYWRKGIQANIVYITEHTTGNFVDSDYRKLIELAAEKLGVVVQWVN